MEEISYPRWLLARWKALVALFIAAILIGGISVASVESWIDTDYQLHAIWPARLSADTPSTLPIALQRWKEDAVLSGSMTLYRGLSPLDGDVPEAFDQDRYVELARGTLDADGTGVLEIPRVEPLPTPLEGGVVPTLLLRLDVDGEERWFVHELEQTDAPVIAVTLDRPLYQPGQTIKMRSLVASATSGRPLDTTVRFVVRDARSNLVMDEEVGTGADGIAATELQLADRCVQGDYTVDVSSGGQTKTRLVEVRPFRLPRFKVSVAAPNEPVQPGGTLKATVTATYTYGEPVEGASVAVTASVGEVSLPDVNGKTDSEGAFDASFSIPRNVAAGSSIQIDATATSVAGRAETGSASAAVAGRSARVEIVPARTDSFRFGREQTAYVIVTSGDGIPISGAVVALVLPEKGAERSITLTTDKKGRAAFKWTPDAEPGSYATVEVREADQVIFSQNLHPNAAHATDTLNVNESVTDVGATLKISLTPKDSSTIVTLTRDSVVVAAATVPPNQDAVTLQVPPDAAGFATVALLTDHGVTQRVPVWIRQRGGEKVKVTLEKPEVRPGTQARVSLSFPPGENATADPPPVMFGLVGVDEALYALKERASVPLHVLMRRAPSTVGAALAAFDEVDRDDVADVDIATHRFRARFSSYSDDDTYSNELSSAFEKHGRIGWLSFLLFIWAVGLIAITVQMVRWTWSITSKEIFSWRRLFAQIAFGVLAGLFAAILGSASGDTFVGGLSVWVIVVGCWVVAAAAKLPEIPLTRWLWAHVLGLVFAGGIAVCANDLGLAPGWMFSAGLGVPFVLAALQWLVWAFALMRDGAVKAGVGIASFAGIFTLGLTGFVMIGGARYDEAPMMAKQVAMEEKSAMTRGAMPPTAPSPVLAKIPGAAGGAAGSASQPARVRSWFPETMVWLPEIASDATGTAKVDLEVPDSITTWRLDAWASTVDGRFGQGQAKLLAIQPYFVELDLPLEVIDGDRFEAPVTLVNRADQPLTVDLAVDTEGPVVLRGGQSSSPTLQPGERKTIWLNIAAVGVGDSTITVRSTSDDGPADAVKRTLAVRPDGRVMRKSTSGLVGKGWESGVNLPPATIENTALAEVRVFGSLVADALGGLDSMLAYPQGCFEQTSSANYPNIMVLRAMRDMKPADWPDGPEEFVKVHKRASKLVRLGYQRMLSFQKPDGGFALYPEHHASDVMLTAYGIMQLVWAKDVTDVDDQVIARAVQWLISQQNEDGSWPAHGVSGSRVGIKDIGLARSTAFVVMALVATGDANIRYAIDRALVRLEKRLDAVESPNALAFMANAFADAGSKELALKVVDRLAAAATRDGQVAYWTDPQPTWMGGMSISATRETTAIAAQALLATESQADLLQPVLSWISTNRGGWGGWGSTQATVWTLRTLETLRQKSSADATLRFYFENEQLSTIAGAKTLQVTSKPQPLRQFEFIPSDAEGRFLVDSSAETTAMVQLVTEYAVDWDSRWAEVDDEAFGGEVEVEQRRTKRGAMTRAYARIENLLETDATMVIVEAPLPPGAFVPNDALDQLVENGAIDMYEILPTHVRFYVDRVPGKQERVFAYDFVPLLRGTFSLPPLRAYPFYSPEPITQIDAGELRTN